MITLFLGSLLLIQQTYAATEELTQPISQEISTQDNTAVVEQSIQKEQADNSEGITVKKVFIAIATPVVIVGAVVTMIVVFPIWLVKKAFGSDK